MPSTPTPIDALLAARTPTQIRDMAATARMYIAGALLYRVTADAPQGRPLPLRYYTALAMVEHGLI